jgi:glutathione S-transferase
MTLVSHHLCPYVQRAAISLAEKDMPFNRKTVDLSNPPEWFQAISPLGKVPVLIINHNGQHHRIFESAAILEYLEDTQAPALHPVDPIMRAQHRGWIELASTVLNRIGSLYNAPTDRTLAEHMLALDTLFSQVESQLGEGPWFAGESFSLVDTAFAPIFRYFDVFEKFLALTLFNDKPKTQAWRQQLASRAAVKRAVGEDYPERLIDFLRLRGSSISQKIPQA